MKVRICENESGIDMHDRMAEIVSYSSKSLLEF